MKTDETKGEAPFPIKPRRVGHKTVRLDHPVAPDAPVEAKAEAAGGSLIAMLLKAIRSDPSDRRRDLRHPALSQEIWVGWWTGDDFGAVNGRLVNFSRGGAQIVMGARPPKKTSVWVYKDIGTTLVSVRGAVVGSTPSPGGAFSVRFRFAVPCPTVLSESIVCRQTRGAKSRAQPSTEGHLPPGH